MKLKLIALAAMLAAGSAQAMTPANDVGTSGNATLLLTVLDTSFNNGVGRSYTRSLEIAMNDFGTQNRATGGFTSIVDTLASNLTWNAGSLWSTFTAGMDANAIANLQWDVTALDGVGTSAVDQKRILTTSPSNLVDAIAASGVSTTNGEFNNAVINQDVYWDAVIAAMGAGTEIVIDDTSSNAFAISAAVHSFNFSGKTPDFTTMGNVGDSMGFYYLTRTSSSGNAEALAVAYGNANGASTFTLAADGTLTFAPPAPVPEASTYGMMLAGLGLVGFMAARRRRV
ncbi:MAG: PEP-CTERM sorting domain-containing protein [Pseudomonadota bacterium]